MVRARRALTPWPVVPIPNATELNMEEDEKTEYKEAVMETDQENTEDLREGQRFRDEKRDGLTSQQTIYGHRQALPGQAKRQYFWIEFPQQYASGREEKVKANLVANLEVVRRKWEGTRLRASL